MTIMSQIAFHIHAIKFAVVVTIQTSPHWEFQVTEFILCKKSRNKPGKYCIRTVNIQKQCHTCVYEYSIQTHSNLLFVIKYTINTYLQSINKINMY